MVFLVPKPSGKFSIIIDLLYLNRYIRKKILRTKAILSVFPLLSQAELLVSTDLRDAYLHVPIVPEHQKFLRVAVFIYSSVRYLQFLALPPPLCSQKLCHLL